MSEYSNNVIRRPWHVSITLPSESHLWVVEGIPVAEIPSSGGTSVVLAFDSPVPRPFSRMSVVRHGTPASREDWDRLVNTCRSHRVPSRPSTETQPKGPHRAPRA